MTKGFARHFFGRSRGLPWLCGFTLVEVMISMAIFMLVIGGAIASHLMGMKLFNLAKAKLGASDEARTSVSMLFDEVRGAKTILVGTGDANSFTACPEGTLQQGNAIQIYPTTNTGFYIRYFWQSDDTVGRMSSTDTAPAVIVNAVSNNLMFTSEDHFGGVLTNGQNNRVIGLFMQIYKLQYPQITINTGGLFEYYQLRTKMTRRVLE